MSGCERKVAQGTRNCLFGDTEFNIAEVVLSLASSCRSFKVRRRSVLHKGMGVNLSVHIIWCGNKTVHGLAWERSRSFRHEHKWCLNMSIVYEQHILNCLLWTKKVNIVDLISGCALSGGWTWLWTRRKHTFERYGGSVKLDAIGDSEYTSGYSQASWGQNIIALYSGLPKVTRISVLRVSNPNLSDFCGQSINLW